MKRISLVFLFGLFELTISAQSIASGPMVGYSAMMEVGLWVQLTEESQVAIKYWPIGDELLARNSKSYTSIDDNWNTIHIPIQKLEPGTTYSYQLIINGSIIKPKSEQQFKTQTLWQHRTDPPEISFAIGSCAYVGEVAYDRPGKPYGGGYEIFESIHRDHPDFMVWLGDNTYLREVDWDSKSGIYHRYSHTRALAELQPLLANVHHYAIWDDHDYGPNDSEGSYALKDVTKQAFKDFWYNPNYGIGNSEGVTGNFTWGDCEFFLLDNRWYRTPQVIDGHILGSIQMEWLQNALLSSKASFKFICIGGQVLSDAAIFENHAVFEKERTALLNMIEKFQIKNVVFLDGDRHHSEMSKLELENDNIVYDITSSPLSSGAYDHSDEPNNNRIKDAIIGERNYTILKVTGPYKNRKVHISFKDVKGKELYNYTIHKSK
jgi:alkaline phosphatase D